MLGHRSIRHEGCAITLSSRLGAVCATAVAAGAMLIATPAYAAFAGAPEDVRFVEITNDHVDLTFVDMSNAEIEFQVEYKQLGTPAWSVVRTYRDHRSTQPGATGVTIRINDLPHTSVGGCVVAVDAEEIARFESLRAQVEADKA